MSLVDRDKLAADKAACGSYEAYEEECAKVGPPTVQVAPDLPPEAPATAEPPPDIPLTSPRTVDGAELLGEIVAFIGKYVVIGDHALWALAVWVLHTYLLDAAEQTPYLIVTAPDKRCGKTRLLEVLELLCFAAWKIDAAPTESVLFRRIERLRSTILLDEFDRLISGQKERANGLVGLLNGANRSGATVPVNIQKGKDWEQVDMSTYCPKVISGIDSAKWPDTLRDRAVTLVLQRRRKDEHVERFKRRKAKPLAELFRLACEEWAEAHLEALKDAEPSCPDGLSDRMEEAWEPLFAIADAAGGAWPQRVREAAVALCAGEEVSDDSLALQLLSDVRDVFGDRDRIKTEHLLAGLRQLPESPWGDWRGGEFGSRPLGKLLRVYKIRSSSIRIGDTTPKGYLREWFEEPWSRYLAPVSATSATSASQSQISGISYPQQDSDVADSESAGNPHGNADVADVAERGGFSGELPDPDYLEYIENLMREEAEVDR